MEAGVLSEPPPRRSLGRPNRLLGDEQLARAVESGNELAFTALFERYHQLLYRYCRSLTGSEQDAQDALQTTFTKALIALRQGRRAAPVRPWLFRIAHNESISVIRSRGTGVPLPLELESLDSSAHSVEERERLATLITDLRELSERQRGALVMRELSGLSHEEIAEALEVSVGAAKQTILEARRSLLEFAKGRAMACDEIQQILSDDDRRSRRSRRVQAHLRDCSGCAVFAAAIPQRRADMLAIWPALPAGGALGLLAKVTGTGSGHGGGSAGLAAGTAAKGLGVTVTMKAAVAAGVTAVAAASVGTVAVIHGSATLRPAGTLPSPPAHVVSHSRPASSVHHSAANAPRSAVKTAAKVHHRTHVSTPRSAAPRGASIHSARGTGHATAPTPATGRHTVNGHRSVIGVPHASKPHHSHVTGGSPAAAKVRSTKAAPVVKSRHSPAPVRRQRKKPSAHQVKTRVTKTAGNGAKSQPAEAVSTTTTTAAGADAGVSSPANSTGHGSGGNSSAGIGGRGANSATTS